MASESKCAKQDFSQIFYEELKCHICESRLIVGKHHWYKCFAFHSVCQDCKEVKENKKCSCTKPIVSEYCDVFNVECRHCLFDLYNNCTDTYTNFKGSDSSFKHRNLKEEVKDENVESGVCDDVDE